MTPLKTIIIDDENHCIEIIAIILKTHCPHVKVVATANNGVQGLKAILQHEPDIVFLDIEMPKMDGFQMLEMLESVNFTLVFTTAYDRYAVRAFKFSAFDYLLKPIDEKELKAVVEKAEHQQTPQKDHISLLKEHYHSSEKTPIRRIALSHAKSFQLIDSQSIIYCEADGNYAKVYLDNKAKFSVIKSLSHFDEILSELAPHEFFRCHRQYLVNLRFVKNYLNTEGGAN
ncbi:MAG: response regulator [Saprospiraceae bacterium]|nr:response regulator [Saprospiraceae bacterium]